MNDRIGVLVWILCASMAAAPSALATSASEPEGVAGLGFMSGCWRAGGGDESTEEMWSAADGGVMLGLSRTLRGGAVVRYELLVIRADAKGGIVMTPYPDGRPSPAEFVLAGISSEGAVFEAPEHDYPKRILYRPEPGGGLGARIDAGAADPDPVTWSYEPVLCPGSRP